MRFAWDARKAETNRRKHGVTFEEACTVFDDPLAIGKMDDLYPDRLTIVGLSGRERLLFCVYAEPDVNVIRIISARRATSHERRTYEEGT